MATGKPVVVAAVRDPYDLAYFPTMTTGLATYSYTDVATRVADPGALSAR